MGEKLNSENQEIDARWQRVRCRVDGEEYICTPHSDYYGATSVDENGVIIGGVCEDHLLSEWGVERVDPAIPLGPDMGIIGRKPDTKAEPEN